MHIKIYTRCTQTLTIATTRNLVISSRPKPMPASKLLHKMVSTFKTLAGEADFATAGGAAAPPEQATEEGPQSSQANPAATVVTHTPTNATGLTVNINVQLTLPEGADEKTYEAFFKAMRTHLLTDPE